MVSRGDRRHVVGERVGDVAQPGELVPDGAVITGGEPGATCGPRRPLADGY
jgi:hypothetical protein